MPRRRTATALGLLGAAMLLVLATTGIAVAAPGHGQARGHDADAASTEGGPGNGNPGGGDRGEGNEGNEGNGQQDGSPGNRASTPGHLGESPTDALTATPVDDVTRVLGVSVVRTGGIDLGPAVAAPATATSAAEPGAGVADQVAAGPGISDPLVSDDASGTDAARTRRVDVAGIVARTPASVAMVLVLLVAALAFLFLHPALDRHDERLVVAGVDDDAARFR